MNVLMDIVADTRVAVARRAQAVPLPALVEELYLVTLSRRPTPEEVADAGRWFKAAPSVREGAADLLWVLFNSREFQFVR